MRIELSAVLIGLVAGIAGCPVSTVDDPCLSQCELAGGGCDEQSIESFADFETTKNDWQAELEKLSGVDFDADGVLDLPFLYAGQCENGPLFLFRATGFTRLVHFFDPDSESFVALRTGTDVIDPVCFGVGYWPKNVDCSGATVTQAVLGGGYADGDPIELP